MIKEMNEMVQDTLGYSIARFLDLIQRMDVLITEFNTRVLDSVNPENKPIEKELDDEEYRDDENYYGLFGDSKSDASDGVDLGDEKPK